MSNILKVSNRYLNYNTDKINTRKILNYLNNFNSDIPYFPDVENKFSEDRLKHMIKDANRIEMIKIKAELMKHLFSTDMELFRTFEIPLNLNERNKAILKILQDKKKIYNTLEKII